MAGSIAKAPADLLFDLVVGSVVLPLVNARAVRQIAVADLTLGLLHDF
jgi:hypothetical protein